MTKKTILNYLSSNKNLFRDKYYIESLALFGSYAKDKMNKNSDIDILYKLKDGHKFTYDDFLNFENELERNLKRKIDLVNEKKLNPLIKLDIFKDIIYV